MPDSVIYIYIYLYLFMNLLLLPTLHNNFSLKKHNNNVVSLLLVMDCKIKYHSVLWSGKQKTFEVAAASFY